MASTSSITQRFSDGSYCGCRCGLFSCLSGRIGSLLIGGCTGAAGSAGASGLRVAAAAIVLFVLMMSGCGEEGGSPATPPPYEEPEWTSLGFESHWTVELELAWPYLYACAADEGLFRANLQEADASWDYVGLADTSLSRFPFGHYTNRGVQDVVVLDGGALLAALHSGIRFFPGVWVSTDDGESWRRSDEGIADPGNEFAGTMINVVRSPCEDSTVYAIGYATYESRDNGATWDLIWGVPESGGIWYHDFEIHPNGCTVMWQGGESALFQPALEKSTDGGNTWEYVELFRIVPCDNAVYDVAIDPFDSRVVYLGMQGAVIKTVDGGDTWISPLFVSRGGSFVRAVALDDKRQGHLFVGAGKWVYESWDGGETMVELEGPSLGTIKDFEYDGEKKMLYVGTLSGVYSYYSP